MAASRSLRTSYAPPKGDFAPIAAINTTPLVDVMLVLLVMFIVIIPAATHKVPLDLPTTPPIPGTPPPVHRLGIAAGGALSWDGREIAHAALPARLRAMARDPARPVLHLDADAEARFELVDRVLADIARSGVTRLGLVDTRRFAAAF